MENGGGGGADWRMEGGCRLVNGGWVQIGEWRVGGE